MATRSAYVRSSSSNGNKKCNNKSTSNGVAAAAAGGGGVGTALLSWKNGLLCLFTSILLTTFVLNLMVSIRLYDNNGLGTAALTDAGGLGVDKFLLHPLLRGRGSGTDGRGEEDMERLRELFPPSIWTVAGRGEEGEEYLEEGSKEREPRRFLSPSISDMVRGKLSEDERSRAVELCGSFLYSSVRRAVTVHDMGYHAFVATGDIDSMWTRDSAVQVGIYYDRVGRDPFLRMVVDGAIRRQAFNIVQDPYANSYSRTWRSPLDLDIRDRVIGRGGWVDSRNYELDSGAYFLTQLYDYYVSRGNAYRPESLLREPVVYDAVLSILRVWTVEQRHDEHSTYRYFELPNDGSGPQSLYTGMTWSGFRPSDDPCTYGYNIPSNIFAASALQRLLELNSRVWGCRRLRQLADALLRGIESGIQLHGVVETSPGSGDHVYAYEVDGLGNALLDFDDANVPSLLSIPLLGWTNYNRTVYRNTRKRLLSRDTNRYYYSGKALRGIGSPHTPRGYVWPMALAIEALTTEGIQDGDGHDENTTVQTSEQQQEHIASSIAFQIRQSLKSACGDSMHESVSSSMGCPKYTREWFEWSNALFVVLIEHGLGERCDAMGHAESLRSSKQSAIRRYEETAPNNRAAGHPATKDEHKAMAPGIGEPHFYQNRHGNNYRKDHFYQGIEAVVKYID